MLIPTRKRSEIDKVKDRNYILEIQDKARKRELNRLKSKLKKLAR